MLDPLAPAILSSDGAYRIWLTRRLGLFGWRPIVFVMLNPSTADARIDDPTLRACIAFAEAWGGSILIVVNLFTLRSPDPRILRKHPNPIGPEADLAIELAIEQVRGTSGMMVAGWGNDGAYMERSAEVRKMIAAAGVPLYRLELNETGEPQHPLYVSRSTRPVLWEYEEA